MFQRGALKIDAHTGMCWEMVKFSFTGLQKGGEGAVNKISNETLGLGKSTKVTVSSKSAT